MLREKSGKLNILSYLEVRLDSSQKNKELSDALRGLITTLFAIILGLGLEEFGKLQSFYGFDAFVLYAAYLAVLLSWYGYHFGIIAGPVENNILSYFIDCLLMICYWLLINKREPFSEEIKWFFVMYLLYALWELIRYVSQDSTYLKKKMGFSFVINSICFLVFLCAYKFFNWIEDYKSTALIVIFIILILYRIIIQRIYQASKKEEVSMASETNELILDLIEKAKIVASRAKTGITHYNVGAAALSGNGNIYTGCNIEFDNLTNTIHAEESVMSAFIASGDSILTHIAVYTSGSSVAFPCGMCRQSLYEIGGKDLKVIACNDSIHEVKTMAELLPMAFRL